MGRGVKLSNQKHGVRFERKEEYGRPGEVKTYFLPLEEVHAKYGPPNKVPKSKKKPNAFSNIFTYVQRRKKKDGEN